MACRNAERWVRAGCAIGCVLLAGCPKLPDPPRPSPSAEGGAGVAITVEPNGETSAAPSVLRLRVHFADATSEAADEVRLFRGTLSSYHLGRIRARSLPETLLEREIPAVVWREALD